MVRFLRFGWMSEMAKWKIILTGKFLYGFRTEPVVKFNAGACNLWCREPTNKVVEAFILRFYRNPVRNVTGVEQPREMLVTAPSC
jgi:hypothetical protein